MHDELRHMTLICEHGTFTKAAKFAGLSQPALTASIQRLEDELDARLFERDRHGARLTAVGEAFLPFARKTLTAVDDGKRAIAELLELKMGEVRIGAGATACTYLLPRTLARFRRAYPGIRIILREVFGQQARDLVNTGALDLCIVTGEGNDYWIDDELLLVGAAGLDAKQAGFVTLPRGTATRTLLEEHFDDPNIVMELNGVAAVKSNVCAGVGKSLLSKYAIQADLRAGRLRRIRSGCGSIRRTLSIIHRGQDSLPPAAASLRKMILEN